jgi:hypothetical protein
MTTQTLDQRLAAKKAQHPERIARDGSFHSHVDAVAYRNAVNDWHDNGKPAAELPALQAMAADLRARNIVVKS